uniref:(California timema) hypothetical protein n=1 Tax=Timema californicum TaxID=61474 RepID=A0A7R9JBJ8_TIMCA|nr:unnamed protein product [Timema californicum]
METCDISLVKQEMVEIIKTEPQNEDEFDVCGLSGIKTERGKGVMGGEYATSSVGEIPEQSYSLTQPSRAGNVILYPGILCENSLLKRLQASRISSAFHVCGDRLFTCLHLVRKQCARPGMFVDKTSHTRTEKRGTFWQTRHNQPVDNSKPVLINNKAIPEGQLGPFDDISPTFMAARFNIAIINRSNTVQNKITEPLAVSRPIPGGRRDRK